MAEDDNLRDLADAMEGDLKKRRDALVVQLHDQRGAFWEDVRALRVEWSVTPFRCLPLDDHMTYWNGQSFHFPVVGRPPAQSLTEVWEVSGTWLRDIRRLYERHVPAAERRNDLSLPGSFEEFMLLPTFEPRRTGGDLFTDHWAPFLSACVVFDPPPDRLSAFADRFRLDPESLVKAWRDRRPDGGARIAPPGMVFVRDPDAVEQAEQAYWQGLIVRVALALEPRGVDLLAELKNVIETDSTWREERRAREASIPVRTYADPMRAANERVWKKLRTPLKRGKSGRPQLSEAAVAEVVALKQSGLTVPEVAKRLGHKVSKDDHDRSRLSYPVRYRRRKQATERARESENRAG